MILKSIETGAGGRRGAPGGAGPLRTRFDFNFDFEISCFRVADPDLNPRTDRISENEWRL